MQQADSERLCAASRSELSHTGELSASERTNDSAVEERALRNSEAHRACHERSGPRRRQRVQVVAILTPNLDQILETRVGDQSDARSLLLQQRIGRDGGTVCDTSLRPPAEHLNEAANHCVGGIERRREYFVDANLAANYRDHIGEGAAGIHPDDDRACAAPLHEALNRILKFSGFAAAANASTPLSSVKVPSISGRGSSLPAASASRARAKRPHREPSTVISFTTIGARLISAPAAAVLLRMMV